MCMRLVTTTSPRLFLLDYSLGCFTGLSSEKVFKESGERRNTLYLTEWKRRVGIFSWLKKKGKDGNYGGWGVRGGVIAKQGALILFFF